ncbi:MAG: peptidase [Bacteroidetes bacterium SW_11_45_7]|nr:MAG: peptidase [Bacteroidetes bacterium SW_11_45_7]
MTYHIHHSLTVFLILFLFIFAACEKDDDNDPSGNDPNDRSANRQGVGASANALLAQDQYQRLVVEVQFPSGFAPRQQTLDNMESFLDRYLNKPEGITVRQSQVSGFGDDAYSIDEIRNIEDDLRTMYTDSNTIAIYLLFVDGERKEDNNNQTTLGVAYYNTSAVLFEETIRNLSGGLGEPDRYKLETAVVNHEIGHLLGLVNNGTPMQQDHQDEDNGSHCDVDDCLMYYAVETGNVVSNLVGSSVPTLDQQCRDDLEANGGK